MRLILSFALLLLLAPGLDAPAKASPPQITLQLNEAAPTGSAQDVALKYFKQHVEAGTHADVKIALHLAGGLGNPQTSVENMMFGELELSSGDLVDYLPLMIDEVSGLTVPFLLTQDQPIRQYLASPLLDEARDKVLNSRHIRFLEMTAIQRPFHIIASTRAVKMLGDLAGLRMSSSQPLQKIVVRAWDRLGVTYVPLAPREWNAALKDHKIDAVLFADIKTAADSGVLQQAHDLTGLSDTPKLWQISINEAAWQRLGSSDQQVLVRAATDSAAIFEKEAARQFRHQIALLTSRQRATYTQFDDTGVRQKLGPLYDALANEGALNPRVVETANQAMDMAR